MQGHSEFYQFATSFWWLLFPLGWGFAGLLRVIFRHHRAEQTLALLKSYADQGKEPPPELLLLLQEPVRPPRRPVNFSRGSLMAGLMFAAMSVAFLVLRASHAGDGDADNQGGLLFVVVLMAGFAIAMFIASYIFARDKQLEKP